MSVDSKMTAIADKIRGLLGLTGEMGLDAMATNLTTEQANIAAALAALAEKGVTVPDGSNSNALAGLIAAIESGGTIAHGEITLAETLEIAAGSDIWTDYYIEHNCGFVPKCFVYIANVDSQNTYFGTSYGASCGIIVPDLDYFRPLYGEICFCAAVGSHSTTGVANARGWYDTPTKSGFGNRVTAEKACWLRHKYNTKTVIPAGVKYSWFAFE